MRRKHPHIETILMAAVELPDKDDRDRFIAQASGGNLELQAELLRLVHGHFSASESFLSAPTVAESSRNSHPGLIHSGEWVGPYQLLNLIGEGGMGKVFVAQQLEPIQRRVALKMIKPGMDSAEVIARFSAERQAIAMMEHPNIASVLDAGVSDRGIPYFVMEYVRGLPITDYCDRYQLTLSQRIELFIDVCHGVQHAHLKGIIHRDLKPSNVLVATHDDRPIPKIIDFGIAKAVTPCFSDDSVRTACSQVVGTPIYMSPEQAGLDRLDIDTRSDVYSLGVLLYQLLTAATPVSVEVIGEHGLEETWRIVREVDPPAPSARLLSLSLAEREVVAGNRNLDYESLYQSLRGELDCIVMMALEKDRDRRYETVSALAADLRRYLCRKPVFACPPSLLYRARKFIQRKKTILLTTLLVSAALFIGLGIAVWQALLVYQERSRANANAVRVVEESARTAEQARQAEQQRQRAELAELERQQERERAEDLLYVSSIRLASRHLQTGDSEYANHLLANWIPKSGQRDRRDIEWYLLCNQLNQIGDELLQLPGDVSSVRISPDQAYLVAATDGGTIQRYSLKENCILTPWESGLIDVRRMEFSPDGSLLAAISYEAHAIVIATATGDVVQHCPPQTQSTKNPDVCFYQGRLLTTGQAGSINVWDLQRRELERVWQTTASMILDFEALPDSDLMAIAAEYEQEPRYQVQIFSSVGAADLTGSLTVSFLPSSMAWHPDGERIAIGGVMGDLELGNFRNSVRLRKWVIVDKLNELAFSPSGRFLAAAERSGAVHLIEWSQAIHPRLDENHRCYFHWAAHRRPARSVIFTPDEQHVVTTGIDGRVVRWVGDQNADKRFPMRDDNWSLVGPSGAEVLASIHHHSLQLNDLKTKGITREKSIPADCGSVLSLTSHEFHPIIALATESRKVLIGRLDDDQAFHALPADPPLQDREVQLGFLAGQTTLVAVEKFPHLRIRSWDLQAGASMLIHENPSIVPLRLAFCHKQESIWVVLEESLLQIDLQSGAVKRRWPINGQIVTRIAVSPDGLTIAAVNQDRMIDLIEVMTGQKRTTLFGHIGTISKLEFSQSGKTLASLDSSDKLRFWHVSSGIEMMNWSQPVAMFDLSQGNQFLSIQNQGSIESYDLRPQGATP